MLRTPRSPWRAAARWSVGLTTIWLLLMTLWLPWIDYGKTYRGVSADLRHALGTNPGCIARRGLGLAQRASLDYFNGIRTVGGSKCRQCRHMIVQAGTAQRTRICRAGPWCAKPRVPATRASACGCIAATS
jgi:hypothetical protein